MVSHPLSSSQCSFRPGDVVRLKSGGYVLTVLRADNAEQVHCAYHIDGQPFLFENFPAAALEPQILSAPDTPVGQLS